MRHPFSCDTSVVLGTVTADGSTIFAKNSDRSLNEAQPLIHLPRKSHPVGSSVQCQYIEIPQVETTWEVICSRPCWLWGFEIGVNEWGVAIGNEAVMTREPFEDKALIGMDIIRLALERSTTADEATNVITALIEQYGQGGSCEEFADRTYHNSFIVADPVSAIIVETAGHHWVTRNVKDKAAIGNLLTISTPDTSSSGLIENARANGWATDPFDFAASYIDPKFDLEPRTCRLDRAREILTGQKNPVTVSDMIALLSDHGDRDLPFQPEPLPTLCMHANPIYPGETAAAMVAHLRPGRPRELTATVWTAFGSPCLSIFRPVYPFGVGLPAELDLGASTYYENAPWWAFERLQRMVAGSPTIASSVRSELNTLQLSFFAAANDVETRASQLIERGENDVARSLLRAFVDDTTRRSLALVCDLTSRFASEARENENPVMAPFWNEINEKAGVISPGSVVR